MTKPAVIQAQLVDMRNVGTHKSLKLTLHIAQEFALEAIEAFGWPTMVEPVPVALAHLNPETMKEVMQNSSPPARTSLSNTQPREEVMPDTGTTLPAARTNDTQPREEVMPDKHPNSGQHNTSPASGPDIPARAHKLAARAALLCKDKMFHHYLESQFLTVITEYDAANYIRSKCFVSSRSDIIYGTPAADKFLGIYADFITWRDADKYVEALA